MHPLDVHNEVRKAFAQFANKAGIMLPSDAVQKLSCGLDDSSNNVLRWCEFKVSYPLLVLLHGLLDASPTWLTLEIRQEQFEKCVNILNFYPILEAMCSFLHSSYIYHSFEALNTWLRLVKIFIVKLEGRRNLLNYEYLRVVFSLDTEKPGRMLKLLCSNWESPIKGKVCVIVDLWFRMIDATIAKS